MMSATVERKKLQHNRMAPGRYRDPHGRLWSCQISKETQQPTTPLTPVGWKSPNPMLTPPQKYLEFGEVQGEMAINYDRWLQDNGEAWKERDGWVMECAVKLFNVGAVRAIKDNDPELMKLAGPGPMSPEFIKAMKANLIDSRAGRWALGLPGANGKPLPMPSWAAAQMATLAIHETYDGSDTDMVIDASRYYDDDGAIEDAQEAADRLAAANQYLDLDEAIEATPRRPARRR